MKKLMAGLVVIVLLVLSSCSKEIISGDGPLVIEMRSLSNFSGVSSALQGDVKITIGPVYKVEIEAQQNILNVLRTRIISGVLEMDFDRDVQVYLLISPYLILNS